MKTKTVTVEEQRELGIRRVQYPPAKAATVAADGPARQPAASALAHPDLVTDMSIAPNATSYVEMRTSAQDRAWGYLISSIPRTFFFSLGLTLVAILATGINLITGIVLLIVTFALVEMISYGYTLAISPEGTAHYEARQKWAILRYEQRQRWQHYGRQAGPPWWIVALRIVTGKGGNHD